MKNNNKYLLIILFLISLFFMTACTDSQEKIVKKYIEEKYGFTPNIVEVNKIYSESLGTALWSGYYDIKCEYNGKEFIVKNFKEPSELYPNDNFESEKFTELGQEYIKKSLDYKPVGIEILNSEYNKFKADDTNIKDYIERIMFKVYTENNNKITISEDKFHELFGDKAQGTIVNFRNEKPNDCNISLFDNLLTDEYFEKFNQIKDDDSYTIQELTKEFNSTIINELYKNKDYIIDIYTTEKVEDPSTFKKSILKHYEF